MFLSVPLCMQIIMNEWLFLSIHTEHCSELTKCLGSTVLEKRDVSCSVVKSDSRPFYIKLVLCSLKDWHVINLFILRIWCKENQPFLD